MPTSPSKERSKQRTAASAWFVYMVRCADGTLYTGIATDVVRRMAEHNAGKAGAKYTRARRPVALVYQESASTRGEATAREAALKALSRGVKETLIRLGA
jgi:putative endonuclease